MSVAGAILYAFVAYALIGVITAIAFVTFGISRVLPRPMPVSLGARILILPGASALWPWILIRWHKATGGR